MTAVVGKMFLRCFEDVPQPRCLGTRGKCLGVLGEMSLSGFEGIPHHRCPIFVSESLFYLECGHSPGSCVLSKMLKLVVVSWREKYCVL